MAHAGVTLQALPEDVIERAFVHLDWLDLLNAARTCRRFRQAAGPQSEAWRVCCTRRWAGPLNCSLFLESRPGPRGATAVNWRRLFTTDNGWSQAALSHGLLGGPGASAVTVVPCAGSAGEPTLAYASLHELCMKVPAAGAAGGSSSPAAQAQRTWRAASPSRGLPTSLAALGGGGGLLAVGSCLGDIHVCQLAEQKCPDGPPGTPAGAVLSWQDIRAAVVELHSLPASGRLVALHDGLEAGQGAARDGVLCVLDCQAGGCVFQAREVFEGYQLAACAAVDEQGRELLAASIKLGDSQQAGLPCWRCPEGIPASLCYHKSHASTAALCAFDTRTAAGMVQRFSTGHRSIYPHLQLLRGHYLATSHVGKPVAVWDRRHMNGPVHEVQHLPVDCGTSLIAESRSQGHLALPLCDYLPFNQALHLDGTQDLLVGRADNGATWLYDLSERLGWADGSHPGSWLRPAEEGADGGDHLDEQDYDRSPMPLGCLPVPGPLPCREGGGAPTWRPRPAVWVGHSWLAGLTAGWSSAAEVSEGEWPAEEEEEAATGEQNSVFWGRLQLQAC